MHSDRLRQHAGRDDMVRSVRFGSVGRFVDHVVQNCVLTTCRRLAARWQHVPCKSPTDSATVPATHLLIYPFIVKAQQRVEDNAHIFFVLQIQTSLAEEHQHTATKTLTTKRQPHRGKASTNNPAFQRNGARKAKDQTVGPTLEWLWLHRVGAAKVSL